MPTYAQLGLGILPFTCKLCSMLPADHGFQPSDAYITDLYSSLSLLFFKLTTLTEVLYHQGLRQQVVLGGLYPIMRHDREERELARQTVSLLERKGGDACCCREFWVRMLSIKLMTPF